MKVAIYTLGCKVNQYETQAMEQELQRRGHTLAPFDGWADAYIINTCTVTAVSDKKSRNAIRRAKKLNPAAVVMMCRPVWRPCHAAARMAQLSDSVPQEVKCRADGWHPSAPAMVRRASSTSSLASRPRGYWAEGLPNWVVSASTMAPATAGDTGVVAA